VDGLAGRVRDVADDSWMPHAVLPAPHAVADGKDVDDLLAQFDVPPGRLAVAMVVAGYAGP
jgi:hypothetical protein